jgi:hypothetical protein
MTDAGTRKSYQIENCYVAFCDILGFSNKIRTDFDKTLEAYEGLARLLGEFKFREVEVTIYSDAILITAENLAAVLEACQNLLYFALTQDFIVRGGIAYGRYWKREIGRHLLVVSDALVRAVEIEKVEAQYPRILIDDNIEVPLNFWVPRFQHEVFACPILHYDGHNIVNPFNFFWFAAAKGRFLKMRDENPGQEVKYDWLLGLADAVERREPLVPSAAIEQLIDMGVLSRIEDGGTSN